MRLTGLIHRTLSDGGRLTLCVTRMWNVPHYSADMGETWTSSKAAAWTKAEQLGPAYRDTRGVWSRTVTR